MLTDAEITTQIWRDIQSCQKEENAGISTEKDVFSAGCTLQLEGPVSPRAGFEHIGR